jgi:hypothetical protein
MDGLKQCVVAGPGYPHCTCLLQTCIVHHKTVHSSKLTLWECVLSSSSSSGMFGSKALHLI